MNCPNCKSENIKHLYDKFSNNIYGSGHRSWKTYKHSYCRACGIMFIDFNENEKNEN